MRLLDGVIRRSKDYVSHVMDRIQTATYSCVDCFQSFGCASLEQAVPVLVTTSGNCYNSNNLTGLGKEEQVLHYNQSSLSCMQFDQLNQCINLFPESYS